MRSYLFSVWRLILYPTLLHILSAALAFLCAIPILFSEITPAFAADITQAYAGAGIVIAPLVSVAFMVLSVVIHMFRLSNTRAFTQLLKWAGIWACTLGCYILLAIAADVSPPQDPESPHSHTADTIYTPQDQLNGPSSLVIPISPEKTAIDTVAAAPNLIALEQEHEELFNSYLNQSPRWSGQEGDDTFYTKPGHLIMVPPSPSGIPALVHVCFRRLVEGDPLPQGYVVVTPGSPFPEIPEDSPQIPDYAVDLGKNHLLLLAWRGSTHRETALRAINAAIEAIDIRMQPLRDAPTPETVQSMLQGRTTYPGTEPELRLCEPLAQNGTYQAELYANPGEPGVILFYIKDLKNGDTLRLLSLKAQYSENPHELFRHDIPGSLPQWSREASDGGTVHIFPHNSPIFTIKLAPQRLHFDAAFEIKFKPSDVRRPVRTLLRRCYKVQTYDSLSIETPRTDAPQA